MSSIWDSVLTAGGSVLGSYLGFKAQKDTNAQNMDLWKMTNAYNDPKEQVKRLQAAGLNPAMIYGSGASSAAGNSGSAPQMQSPGSPVGSNPMKDYYVIKNEQANLDILRANYAKTVADTAKTVAETPGVDAKSKQSILDYGLNKQSDTSSQDGVWGFINRFGGRLGNYMANMFQ